MRAALRWAICGLIGLVLLASTLMRMFYESLPTKWNMAKYLFGYNVLFYTIGYLFIIRPWREAALEVDKDDQEVTTSKTAPKIKIREVDDAPPTVYDRQMRLYDARLQAARVESLKRRAAISLRAHAGGGFGAGSVVMNECKELLAECEDLLVGSYMGECSSKDLEPLVSRLRTWVLVRCGAGLNLKERVQLATPLKDNEGVIEEAVIPVFVHALFALDSFQQRASTVFEAEPLSTNPEDQPSKITRVRCHLEGKKDLKPRWLVTKARLLLRKVRGVPCSFKAIDKELQWRRTQLEALRSTVPVNPPPSDATVLAAKNFVPSTPSRGAVDAELGGAFSGCETYRSARVDGARPASFDVARRRLRSIRSRVRLRGSPAQALHRRSRLLSRGRRRTPRSRTSRMRNFRTTRLNRSRATRRPLRLTFALLEKPPRSGRVRPASSPGRRRLNRSWAACRRPPTCVLDATSGRPC